MRQTSIFDTWVIVAVAGAMLAASVFLIADAVAGELTTGPSCSCPESASKSTPPRIADYSRLDRDDEVAALASVQTALSQMDDGTPFVWKRGNGRLSGIVRPTRSFRNQAGAICRHVVILLTTGYRTRTAEGVACRQNGGRWQLDG